MGRQAAGNVVKQLWETWPDYEDVLYNINVPLDYRDVDGNPNRQPKIVFTRVDSRSQYTSLYSAPLSVLLPNATGHMRPD